jgi:hypothetical protein
MTNNLGVPASPSGHSRVEPQASPAKPSVPNADILPADIIQITRPDHPWFPSIAVVSEVKSFGVQAFVFMPANDGTGEAYIRLSADDYEPVGAAALVVSRSLADAHAQAIEARRAETATEIGGSVHESAVGPADAPKGGSNE